MHVSDGYESISLRYHYTTTIVNDYTSSTNYGKPLQVKGTFKMLQDRGANITNYTEKDGAGRTITHQQDYDEDDYDEAACSTGWVEKPVSEQEKANEAIEDNEDER